MNNIISVIPTVPVSDHLLSLLKKWEKLAPSECRIQAEWDGGLAAQVGHKLIHVHGEITQAEHDYLFCRVLDRVSDRPNWESVVFNSINPIQSDAKWTGRVYRCDDFEPFDKADGDRLTALLGAYTAALEALEVAAC